MNEAAKKICFVDMPFGRKTDPKSGTEIDFDQIYDVGIRPAIESAGLAAVRGDRREPVQQGDLVFAFGSPFDFRFSMCSGVVSGKGRSVDVLGPTGYENFIQVLRGSLFQNVSLKAMW